MTNIYDGSWHTHDFCAKFDHKVTWHQMMYNFGCCPYCGNIVPGTVMEIVQKPMRWISAERKWWQIWRINEGKFESMKDISS